MEAEQAVEYAKDWFLLGSSKEKFFVKVKRGGEEAD